MIHLLTCMSPRPGARMTTIWICPKDVEKSKSMELYDCPFHVCFDDRVRELRMAQGETDNKVPVGKEVQ